VIVNEFGDLGVDGALIESLQSEGVAEIEGGCLCCVGREDMTGALYDMITRKDPPEYLLVELSGLADPVPVAQTFLTTEFRGLLELDGIVAVADARNLEQTLSQAPEGRAQLAYASVVLLNKCDDLPEETVAAAEGRIRSINPLARVMRTTRAAVETAEVTGLKAFDPNWKPADYRLEHSPNVSALTLRSEEPLQLGRWVMFHHAMIMNRAASVYRAKGVLEFEELDYPMVLQAVRGLYSFDSFDGEHPGGSEVVIIGRNLDEAEYREAFERLVGGGGSAGRAAGGTGGKAG
jgi:G3E family GTPase